MSDDQAFQRCVQAFADRDYAACANQAMTQLSTGASHELLQLLLISLQRLGQTQLIEQLGPQVLAATARDPWANALLKVTLGVVDPAEVWAQAGNEERRRQVLFYAGARLLSDGQTEAARQRLGACLTGEANNLVRFLAQVELASVAPDPPRSAQGAPSQQIDRLNQQVVQLYQQGRHAQAMELATQARDLARQHLGEEHPDYAISLNNLAGLHQSMGNYAAAESLYQQAGEILRAALGEEHPDYATSLNSLALLYRSMGNYAAAEPLLKQALGIRRTALGEEHPDYATSLNNLAALYQSTGNYEAAEPLYQKAAEIDRVTLGAAHPDYAISLNNLAALYRSMGNFAAAEPLYQQAGEVLRTALGEEHPSYASSLDNLAGLYRAMGKYAAAEPLYQQAIGIKRTALGEEHPSYASSVNNLAELYRTMGNYAAAEPLYQKAGEIIRTVLGEEHPNFASSLNNLAALYQSMGNYAAAEPLYQKASEIDRVTLGGGHPDYAVSLNNLALLRQSMGNYAAAEPLFQQVIGIRCNALGKEHPSYASSLNNLAELYRTMGNYAAAEPLYKQASEIDRAALGADHPDYATGLNNLALLCHSMGNFAAAEPLYKRAGAIDRVALGEDHPGYATDLNNLALLYQSMGNYAAAEPLYKQALGIRHAVLGESHPDYAASLKNLASLFIATGRAAEAFPLMEQAAAIDDRLIGQIFSIGSESQRTAFLETVRGNRDAFLSLVWRYLGASAEAVRAAMDLVLRRKAIGSEALAAQRDAVLGGKYPALESRLREWSTLRCQIAQKTLAGPGPEGLQAHQRQLAEWSLQKERLEAELARQIPEMNLERRLRAADRRAVALGLPEGVALVEFVRFDVFDFHAVPARGEQYWQPAHYLAFVVPARELDSVRMIDLGEAGSIDRMIADFRSTLLREEHRDIVVQHWTTTPLAAEIGAGAALRAALFDPLLSVLGDRTRLLLAPDGGLSRLPFEVLPTADGRLLMDRYTISYLGCGRDVLRFGVASTGQPAEALVAADPDFDFGGDGPVMAAAAEPTRGRRSRNLDSIRFPVVRLPATQVEGERIAAMLAVQPWMGPAVLEGRLKDQCRSPRILHLATHGFFLEDQEHDPAQGLRDLGALGGDSGRLSGPLPENPLLRAGLVLAGVNTWHATGRVHPEAEDGLLTAEDVSGMDLLATELVVLSACETGLGEVRTGEGVFGLQRAFVLAGAKTLVMSLWAVPDLTTAILMDRFYENLLHRGLGRAEALHDAQQHVRTLTVGTIRETWLSPAMIDRLAAGQPDAELDLHELSRQPDDHRPLAHPSYWGAFVCLGNPGPLPSSVLQESGASSRPSR